MNLDARKQKILQVIVQDYIASAEPVGSRTIARKYDLGISPATIRNEMFDLEMMGYLEQPHTSAGRVPSLKGYRLYVDCLLKPTKITEAEKQFVQSWFQDKLSSVDEIFQSTAKLLARITHNVTLIMASERQGSDETVSLERLREEVPVDSRRVHFVGFRPYEEYRLLLRASTVHVYFTAPFALSAGLFESMSCGCLLVSSDTEPVREVVRHGENGFLCDFWDHDMLADMTTELLARSDAMGPVRAAARQSIVEEYNLKVQIPRHMDLLLSTYADWKKARQTS